MKNIREGFCKKAGIGDIAYDFGDWLEKNMGSLTPKQVSAAKHIIGIENDGEYAAFDMLRNEERNAILHTLEPVWKKYINQIRGNRKAATLKKWEENKDKGQLNPLSHATSKGFIGSALGGLAGLGVTGISTSPLRLFNKGRVGANIATGLGTFLGAAAGGASAYSTARKNNYHGKSKQDILKEIADSNAEDLDKVPTMAPIWGEYD